MNINATVLKVNTLKEKVDWKLLLFLLLFLNVKLAIKIPAVALMCILQFDFRFGFKFRDSRLPLFYPAIIIIGVISALSSSFYTEANYLVVLATGIGFWCLCILAAHQVKLAVERNEPLIVHQTIVLFFILNALVSLLNLGLIVLETHAVNPYTWQGQYQKYFMNTGDYIRGITFDTSTTNAVLNSFGIIYFLIKSNIPLLLLCMIIMLLTGSNFINLVLFGILGLLFIFRSSSTQKSLIMVCLAFFVVFNVKISPQNKKMVLATSKSILHLDSRDQESVGPVLRITERPDSILSFEERREKIATLSLDSFYSANEKYYLSKNMLEGASPIPGAVPFLPGQRHPVLFAAGGRIMLPQANIHSASFQHLNSTPPEQRRLTVFIGAHRAQLPVSGKPYHWSRLPGKVQGWLQTVRFFVHHPWKIIAGTGPGNFSSKLAFRVSDLGFSGGYPARYTYISPDFLVNHLDLYLNFFSRRAEFHSLMNSPFSVYDQLLAEYGIAGLLAFISCYAWFFIRHWNQLTYGPPLLAFTFMILLIDYWFEQLSVMVFFELLLFLDIKESAAKII